MSNIEWLNQKRKVKELKPYPGNPRKWEEEARKRLKESLDMFNVSEPLIINTDGTVIGGNFRLSILDEKGVEWTDVRVPNRELTKEEADELNLRLNKNQGEWDFNLLEAFGEDLLGKIGFDSKTLDKVFNMKPEDEEAIPALEEGEQTTAQYGDIYDLGGCRLMCGDSTKREDVERLMGGKKAKMVFTDPPWNVAIGGDGNPRHRQRPGLINDDLGEHFGEFLEAAAKNIDAFCDGDIYCVMGCEEWPTIHAALTGAGLHWSATIIWKKDIFVLGRSKYHRRYEPIWYGWRDKSSYCGGRDQDDVWEYARPKRSEDHPTMKPVELVAHAIRNSSDRGDIVLDLFAGSGSTIIAAIGEGRVAYGMELDPRYVDRIIARWEKYTGQKAIKA